MPPSVGTGEVEKDAQVDINGTTEGTIPLPIAEEASTKTEAAAEMTATEIKTTEDTTSVERPTEIAVDSHTVEAATEVPVETEKSLPETPSEIAAIESTLKTAVDIISETSVEISTRADDVVTVIGESVVNVPDEKAAIENAAETDTTPKTVAIETVEILAETAAVETHVEEPDIETHDDKVAVEPPCETIEKPSETNANETVIQTTSNTDTVVETSVEAPAETIAADTHCETASDEISNETLTDTAAVEVPADTVALEIHSDTVVVTHDEKIGAETSVTVSPDETVAVEILTEKEAVEAPAVSNTDTPSDPSNIEVAVIKEETSIPLADTTETSKEAANEVAAVDIVATENKIDESSNRDSYQATKEEIEDSLEFIKAKLNPPEAPVKTKRVSKECKEEEDIPAPVVIPLPVVVPNKTSDVLETKKESTTVSPATANTESEPIVEKFATECIPPVRPERLKRNSAKLTVPDWQPPKQNFISYIFGCFNPKPSE